MSYVKVVGNSDLVIAPSLLLHNPALRVLFNVGENVQRFSVEHRVKIGKISEIFLTQVTPQTIGGLPGLLLTLESARGEFLNEVKSDEIYDSTARCMQQHWSPTISSPEQPHLKECDFRAPGSEETAISIYGPPPIIELMRQISVKFLYLKTTALKIVEVRPAGSWTRFVLQNEPGQISLKIKCYDAGTPRDPSASRAKKVKVLSEQRIPTRFCLAFLIKYPDHMGKMNMERVKKLNVPIGSDLKKLKGGESVTLKDGTVVDPLDVCDGVVRGAGFGVAQFSAATHKRFTEDMIEEGGDPKSPVDMIFDMTYGKNDEECVSQCPSDAAVPLLKCWSPVAHNSYVPPFIATRKLRSLLRSIMTEVFVPEDFVPDDTQSGFAPADAFRTATPAHNSVLPSFAVYHILPDSKRGFQIEEGPAEEFSCGAEPFAQNLEEYHQQKHFQKNIEENKKNKNKKLNGNIKKNHPQKLAGSLGAHSEKNFEGHPGERACDDIKERVQQAGETQGTSSTLSNGWAETVKKCKEVFRECIACYQSSRSSKELNTHGTSVLFLGTGASMPSKHRNVSAILVKHSTPDFKRINILLDCGEGTLSQILVSSKNLEEFQETIRNIGIIFISHIHGDHHFGIQLLLFEVCKWRKAPLYVYGPQLLGEWLQWYDEFVSPLNFVFIPCNTIKTICPVDGVELVSIPVKHVKSSECFGVLLKLRKSDGSEATLVYSGDTRPCETLVRQGRNCDVLIHEATFDDALQQDAVAKRHSTIQEALGVAEQMKAKFTLLTHFSQRYPSIPGTPLVDVDYAPAIDHLCVPFELVVHAPSARLLSKGFLLLQEVLNTSPRCPGENEKAKS